MRKKDTRHQAPPHATDKVSSDNEGETLPHEPQLLPLSSTPPPAPCSPAPQHERHQQFEQRMERFEQRMDQMQQQMQQLLAAIAVKDKAPAVPPPAAARTQHASPAPPSPAPPPTLAQDIFAAQATADRKKRDACETLRRLDPYEGKLSEVYTSPLDFVLAVERVTGHQHADAHLTDEQVIAQVAGLLRYDALGWFNASYPAGSVAPELRHWAAFRAAFLAEHMDAQQVYTAADDLVSPERMRMLAPTAFALENYDRMFKRTLNLLSTSATMGHPNAAGPPNDAWTTHIYYSGLHIDLKTILAPERASLTTLAALRARARAVATPDEPDSTYDDASGTSWTSTSSLHRSLSRRGRHADNRWTRTSTGTKTGRPLCTHEWHHTKVNHTWQQCQLNPDSEQYDAAYAERAERTYNARRAQVHPPAPAPSSHTASAQAGRAFHASNQDQHSRPNGFAALAHELARERENSWLSHAEHEDVALVGSPL